MDSSSFNLMLTNLAIGLVKGHPYLRPTSTQVKALGYRLFCVERKLFCSAANKTVAPELVFYSPNKDHAVLCEWTCAPVGDNGLRKAQQIQVFLAFAKEDLVDRAGMPNPGGNRNSLWVVVRRENIEAFEQSVADSLDRAMLCSFQINGSGGTVLHHQGEFQDNDLSGLFKSGITARRIPMGYVPISLDNFSAFQLDELLLQQLVTYIVRRKTHFTAFDICESVFGKQWVLLGKEKKTGLMNYAKLTIKELEQRQYLQEWLIRTSAEPLTWCIGIPKGKDQSISLSKLNTRAQKYLHDKFAGPNAPSYQYNLFDQPDTLELGSD